MLAAKKKAEQKYGKKNLLANVQSDFDWGYLSGRVAAIRWVLGSDWDNLDS